MHNISKVRFGSSSTSPQFHPGWFRGTFATMINWLGNLWKKRGSFGVMVTENGNSHWQLCGKGSAGTQHRKHKGQAAVLCETSLLHNKPRPWGHARKILIQSWGNVSRPKHLHWSPHAHLPTLPHRKLKLQNKSSYGAYLKDSQIPLDLFSCLLRPFIIWQAVDGSMDVRSFG